MSYQANQPFYQEYKTPDGTLLKVQISPPGTPPPGSMPTGRSFDSMGNLIAGGSQGGGSGGGTGPGGPSQDSLGGSGLGGPTPGPLPGPGPGPTYGSPPSGHRIDSTTAFGAILGFITLGGFVSHRRKKKGKR